MAKSTFNKKAQPISESGFGTNSNYSGGRFYNKDGTPNIVVNGVPFFKKFSLYNFMLHLSAFRFLMLLVLFYLVMNLIFAFIYLWVGIHHLGGIEQHDSIGKFFEGFFFSVQTLSTVGYGHVFPKSLLANGIAAAESLLGLLALALVTGLMYGRFSQPKAYIKYSKNALLSPFKNGTAIMFRMAPFKHNHLIDAEVKLTLVLRVDVDGVLTNRFYNLDLEIAKVNSLTMNWTVVHPINATSPFFEVSETDLLNLQAELIVFTKAFDEAYSNYVVSRTSYTADEFVFGAKFSMMYNSTKHNTTTVLHMEKLNLYEKVPLPETEYA